MLEKFLDIISHYIPISPVPKGIERELSALNPDKIYAENVRHLLDVSYETAIEICERAVRQGYFKRGGIEVRCPDNTVAAIVPSKEQLPKTVKCLIEEEGFLEEKDVPISTLDVEPFYQLDERATTSLYRQATQNL